MNKFRFTINVLAIAIFMFAFASMRSGAGNAHLGIRRRRRRQPMQPHRALQDFCRAPFPRPPQTAKSMPSIQVASAPSRLPNQSPSTALAWASVLACFLRRLGVKGKGAGVGLRGRGITGTGANRATNPINIIQGKGKAVEVDDPRFGTARTAGTNPARRLLSANDPYLRNVTIRNCAIGVNINNTGARCDCDDVATSGLPGPSNNLHARNGGRGRD